MRMESNYWQVFVNAVTGFWGGILLAVVTGIFYAFYSAVIMMIFSTGHEHNDLGGGCIGMFLLIAFMFYCLKFARGGGNRGMDMCILCMAVGLGAFLSSVDPLDLYGAGASLLIIMTTPFITLWIFRAVRRRQIHLLEQQADEMEEKRILGPRVRE